MKLFKIYKVENGVIKHVPGDTEYLVNLLNNEKGYYSTYTIAYEEAIKQRIIKKNNRP